MHTPGKSERAERELHLPAAPVSPSTKPAVDGSSPHPVTRSPRHPVTPSPRREPLLLFDRVSKWYGPVIGVNQVTLELRPGITGLVGANGAGKSTLLRLATGQLRPDLGRVQVLGLDAWDTRSRFAAGYCPEVDAFYEEMSGRQFVETMARLCGYTRAEARQKTEY